MGVQYSANCAIDGGSNRFESTRMLLEKRSPVTVANAEKPNAKISCLIRRNVIAGAHN
jgi:hypothetical protein